MVVSVWLGGPTTMNDRDKDTGLVTRRRILKGAGVAAGTTALAAAAQPAAAQQSGGLQELIECQGGWNTAPDGYPEIELKTQDPHTRNFPSDPDEIMVYAIGWSAEGQFGRDQAWTLEQALNQNGFVAPVVAAQWEANGLIYSNVQDNADRDGRRLADWLRSYHNENPDVTIHLSGLSLGARVPFATLDALDGDVPIASVTVWGATNANDSICTDSRTYDGDAIEATATRVYNYHSTNDNSACDIIPLLSFNPALGCRGAVCDGGWFSRGSVPNNWVDRDVSDRIDAHCQYQQPSNGIGDQIVQDINEAKQLADDGSSGSGGSGGSDGGSGGDGSSGSSDDGDDGFSFFDLFNWF